MEEIRYVHAADLHLDAPFYGIAKEDAALAERIRDASFRAMTSLVNLCLAQKPDFLLLAGDIIHQDSARAHLRLRDACETLRKADIPVFMVHGNHDPASSRIAAINWPANTVIFDINGQTAPVNKNGETLALVHGASHAKAQEGRNLAALLHRDAQFPGFQIGLLHCNVDGAVAADRYAPCTLKDLQASGLDAWALGHAHTRNILSEQPFIAYSGNTQGLHINETGPRGCFLVTARRDGGLWQCSAEFHELDAARWQKDIINMDNINSLDALDGEINARMAQAASRCGNADTGIMALELTGTTDLHDQLAKLDLQTDFGREPLYENGKDIWLTRISLETSPPLEPQNNLDRDDLLGEISRLARELETDGKALADIIAQAGRPLANACRQLLPELRDDERVNMLARARKICQDMLEGR